MNKETKYEKPLKLNMSFREAFRRFVSVNKKEIKAEINKEKAKKEK